MSELQQTRLSASFQAVALAITAAALVASCAQEPQRARPIDDFQAAGEAATADADDARAVDATDAEPDVSQDTSEDVGGDSDDVTEVEDSETVEDTDDTGDSTDVTDTTDSTDVTDTTDSTDVTDTTDSTDVADTTDSSDVTDTTDSTDVTDTSDVTDGDVTEPGVCDRWDAFSDSQLRDELNEYVSNNHEFVGSTDSECYRWARNYMYGVEEGGLVIDQPIDVFDGNYEGLYTGRLVPYTRSSASRTPGGFNTEHSWPQSQGADSLPERCDIHHLFPADGDVNSTRSNLDFGETSCGPPSGGFCSCCDGGSEVGTSQTSSDTVFQVRLARQGDVARAHFYFAIRYDFSIGASEENVLRAWHVADPVVGAGETAPSREQIRNDRIEAVQNNRNPFVDCPDLVDRISNF